MKKILNLILVSVILVAFVGCKSDKPIEPEKTDQQTQDLEALKAKVKNLEEKNIKAEEDGTSKVEEPVKKAEEPVKKAAEPVKKAEEPVKKAEEPVKKEEPKKEVYTGDSFISLSSPSENAGISTEPITFTGKVSPNTQKIVVKQSYIEGKGGSYTNGDTYTLKDFKEGDEIFTYKASPKWGNLVKGAMNKYQFTAYFLDGSTKTSSRNITSVYSEANYLSIDSPASGATMADEPVIFVGTVSPNTTKIVATGTGGTKGCDEGLVDGICTSYYYDVYTLKEFKIGDSLFTYKAAQKWHNLTVGSNSFTFTAYYDDGSSQSKSLEVFFTPGGAEMGKPVIYLYPEKTSAVSVNVEPTGGISISKPELRSGWNVIATPESRIYNIADGKFYPYLFWEGFATNFSTPKDGFVVASKDVASFFDRKLSVLGMNKKEIADFKEFWVPRLQEKPYYFITFVDQKTFDNYAPLTVNPKPDSVIRVFFDYKGIDRPVRVQAQKFTTPERKGFTVVEWGGRLY